MDAAFLVVETSRTKGIATGFVPGGLAALGPCLPVNMHIPDMKLGSLALERIDEFVEEVKG